MGHTLNWSHVYDVLSATGSNIDYYTLAPKWNLGGPFNGLVNFNVTITPYPGDPYHGFGNIPTGFVTHSINGNGTFGQDNNFT